MNAGKVRDARADEAAARVLVLGLGNSLRGDDAAGVLVAHALARQAPPGVRVLACEGSMLDVLEPCAGLDALVCIDACAPAGQPGRVHRLDWDGGALPVPQRELSGHALGLAEALALGRALGLLPATVVVYAVEAAGFDFAAEPHPQVSAALQALQPRLLAELDDLLRGPAQP